VRKPAIADKGIFSWVLYDFANSIYSTGVLSLYAGLWATKNLGVSESAYGNTLSLSMLAVAALAPWLGAWSDRVRKRRPFVIVLTAVCCIATALLGYTTHALLGLVLLGLSNFAYQLATVPYNAQLPEIADHAKIGRVSGWGAGFNALGSTFVALVVPRFVPKAGEEVLRQAAFGPIGGLFALFAVPLALFTREKGVPPTADTRTPSWAETWRDLLEARKIPGVWQFLAANLLIQDAGSTIVAFFALYAVNALGFSEAAREPANLMALAAIGGIVSGPIWGWLSDRFGPRRVFIWDAVLWLVVLGLMPLVTAKIAYFVFFGPAVGAAIAGTVCVQRPLMADLAPPDKRGEYFGMLALVGRMAAIIGPVTWGAITTALAGHGFLRYQAAIGSLVLLTAAGLYFLLKVPDTRKAKLLEVGAGR